MDGCKKFGDWGKFRRVIHGLYTGLKDAYKLKINEDGQVILEKLREHIEQQDLNWAPLADSTVSRKGNDTIYIDTGFLLDHLDAFEVNVGKDHSVFIGAPKGVTHPNGLDVSTLMTYMEFGTAHMPARPLLRPTKDEMEQLLKTGWFEVLVNTIRGLY